MRQGISFVGLLAFGNQDSIAKHNIHSNFKKFSPLSTNIRYDTVDRPNSIRNPCLTSAIRIRGGALKSSSTQLSASTAMASLLAGSIGGAVGVGMAYPFDTLSTKAQVSTGNDESHLSFTRNLVKIWRSEGIAGFFDGVLVTVSSLSILL